MHLGRDLAFDPFEALGHFLGKFALFGDLEFELGFGLLHDAAVLGCVRNRFFLRQQEVAGIPFGHVDRRADYP